MSDIAIKVENISKAYRIGLKEQRHDTLGAAIAAWLQSPLRNFKKLKSLSNFKNQNDADIFWALKDINFEVKKGEVLGIIGKNGAGKSTLLKILSRITEPTSGRIEIYGRVASLLEVGTGFNPELTGRENVFLNGTILGMTKKEIDKKFDEIIDFSGVEKFIDTPVKRYSSGMKVRLAFAVAAYLESEILIVDEVLAVGDAEFQKKCLGKMGELSRADGRTVLFVSHNMAAVKNLCVRGITINQGSIIFDGVASEAIDLYFSNGLNMAETGVIPSDMKRNYGTNDVKFSRVQLINHNNQPHKDFYYGEPIKVMVDLSIFKEIPGYNITLMVGTLDGQRILFSELNSDNSGKYGLLNNFAIGNYQLELDINTPLLPGSYSIYLGFSLLNGTTLEWVERVHDFIVNKTGFIKNEHYRWTESHGLVLNKTNWKLIKI